MMRCYARDCRDSIKNFRGFFWGMRWEMPKVLVRVGPMIASEMNSDLPLQGTLPREPGAGIKET